MHLGKSVHSCAPGTPYAVPAPTESVQGSDQGQCVGMGVHGMDEIHVVPSADMPLELFQTQVSTLARALPPNRVRPLPCAYTADLKPRLGIGAQHAVCDLAMSIR